MPAINHLKAIQVFETVARTGNITLAAEKLKVTQSAISYHIQMLETQVGATLFERRQRGVILTERGAKLLPFVRDGLRSIELGLQAIAAEEAGVVVRVAVLPMFASRWLAPRLKEFWDTYPKTELSFTHDNNTYSNNLNPGEIADLAVQWGTGDWPNVESHLLLKEPLIAACSPDLLRRTPLQRIEDLASHSLLHVDNHDMWRQWLRAAGADEALAGRGLMMTDRHFQLSATLNGVGVSLFVKSFIRDELAKGALVSPLPHEYHTNFAYYLVRPRHAKYALAATQFYNWIIGQARLAAN